LEYRKKKEIIIEELGIKIQPPIWRLFDCYIYLHNKLTKKKLFSFIKDMQIQAYHTQNNTTFGIKLKTKDVLEVTTQKQLQNRGVDGIKNVLLTLQPSLKNHIGNIGYRGHAKILGQKILEKYQELVKPTEILNIAFADKTRPLKDNSELIDKIVKELGETIDISI